MLQEDTTNPRIKNGFAWWLAILYLEDWAIYFIAERYFITCSQSACSHLKKHEFRRNFNVEYKLYHKITSIIG